MTQIAQNKAYLSPLMHINSLMQFTGPQQRVTNSQADWIVGLLSEGKVQVPTIGTLMLVHP